MKFWARAQEIIRQQAQSKALKADLVKSTPKSQGHVVMALSVARSNLTKAIESVSRETDKKKYDTNTRGREKLRGGEAQSSKRSSRDPSNSRVCWNCNEVTNDHFGNTCPKPQRKKDYPKERGGATQGS